MVKKLLLFFLLLCLFSVLVSGQPISLEDMSTNELLLSMSLDISFLQNQLIERTSSYLILEQLLEKSKKDYENERLLTKKEKNLTEQEKQRFEDTKKLYEDLLLEEEVSQKALIDLNSTITRLLEEYNQLLKSKKFWKTTTVVAVGFIIIEGIIIYFKN